MYATHALGEFQRYHDQLLQIIRALDEEQLWRVPAGHRASVGVLVKHLTGNINHYYGACLIGNAYVRDRDFEFDTTPSRREAHWYRISVRASARCVTLPGRSPMTPFAGVRYQRSALSECRSVAHLMMRLLAHYAYHVGQRMC